MTSTPVARRLAAIVTADVVGFARLMEGDEAGTHARLRESRDNVTDPRNAEFGGRIVETAGDDIAGDGVNVAARLETLAEAGGICIGSTVYEQVHGNPAFGFVDMGEHRVPLRKLVPGYTIARSKAIRSSDNADFWEKIETHRWVGLRKAGIPEQ